MNSQAGAQSPLLSTTSYTAPVVWKAAGAYLAAASAGEKTQPLCGNSEGWGPLSPIRYDFTPCFLDVWISAVALFGILFGAGAVWYLMRNAKQDIGRNWHFWAKMVGECLSGG
jgi:ATP-binding cassette, subfamily C (CFTR/MRP), member 1